MKYIAIALVSLFSLSLVACSEATNTTVSDSASYASRCAQDGGTMVNDDCDYPNTNQHAQTN